MVNGVIIDERISVGNNEISERFSREGRQFGFQISHKLVGGFLRDAFKIVAEIVASAIFPPVIQCNFFYGFSGFGNYAEPEQGSPNAVFSRIWAAPAPKLSSPQKVMRLESIR